MIVLVNGLDSTKEHMYASNHWEELAARGISCLMLDQPGTGEALRLQGLTARIDTEAWGGAAIDYLETRSDVDASRIGIVGWSLGGYYSPRAAAFEKRFALCVAWGANHNWGAVQRRRKEREGERPVPHYWEHVLWVWGQEGDDLDAFLDCAEASTSTGVEQIGAVPDRARRHVRQIPLDYAHRSYEQAVNSPKRELRVFTPDEGATSTSAWTTCPRQHLHRRLGRRHLRRARRQPGLRGTSMSMLFLNLAVADVARSRAFLRGAGFQRQRALVGRDDGRHRAGRRRGVDAASPRPVRRAGGG